MVNEQIRKYLPAIPALIIYSIFCYLLNFTQDDAFISYRYVANFLNGDGLVFNIGERVEGMTNFGWVMYLIFWGKLGLDYILISKISGFIFGGGIIVLTYLIAEKLFSDLEYKKYAIVASLLIGVNQSLAYWSIAGLETAAFGFFALWSFYLYLQKINLIIFTLLISVFLRPEGAFVTGLLILVEAITERKIPRFMLKSAFSALVLSLPYVAFKLWYYGSILPNPFYAKTGFTMTQLANGWEYISRFMQHYGLYGLPILIPILFIKKMSRQMLSVWLFTLIYLLYIMLVGGDVLKVHRFYIPLFGLYAILIVYALTLLFEKISFKSTEVFLPIVALLLVGLTYYLPNDFIKDYNRLERLFVHKMSKMANNLKDYDKSNFTVALPTIGVFGYELIGHKIIDLVGLTDTTIAKHHEPPIPGMVTTWKESKHNSKYILESNPEYIMFSTGAKPSAPAEKALMLYPRFLFSYYQLGWYYQPPKADYGSMQMVFKRKDTTIGEIAPTYPLEWVDNYKLGFEEYSKSRNVQAIQYYEQAIKDSPQPVYPYLLYQLGFSYLALQKNKLALNIFNKTLEVDSLVFMAHRDLYQLETVLGNREKLRIHKLWLEKMVPWYVPRVDTLMTDLLKRVNLPENR